HDVTVITVTQEDLPVRELRRGVHILRLPQVSGSGEGPVLTLRSWQNRADAVADALRRMTRSGGVDLVEFCDYRGEGVTYLASTPPAERPVCVVRLHTPLSVLNKYNTGHTRHVVLEEYEHEALRLADRI